MTRAPTKKPSRSAAERKPFSFLLPPDLVAEIDAIADAESRSRVRTVEVILREYVQSYRRAAPLAKHRAQPTARGRAVRGGKAA
jgi:predicted transcriptional regulator